MKILTLLSCLALSMNLFGLQVSNCVTLSKMGYLELYSCCSKPSGELAIAWQGSDTEDREETTVYVAERDSKGNWDHYSVYQSTSDRISTTLSYDEKGNLHLFFYDQAQKYAIKPQNGSWSTIDNLETKSYYPYAALLPEGIALVQGNYTIKDISILSNVTQINGLPFSIIELPSELHINRVAYNPAGDILVSYTKGYEPYTLGCYFFHEGNITHLPPCFSSLKYFTIFSTVSETGQCAIVWHQKAQGLYAITYTQGQWSQPELISTKSSIFLDVDIAAAGNDFMACCFSNSKMTTLYKAAEEKWTEVPFTKNKIDTWDLKGDCEGNFIATWTSKGQAFVSCWLKETLSWSEPVKVAEANVYYSQVVMVKDRQGVIFLEELSNEEDSFETYTLQAVDFNY